jgi:hypothetical protein
MVVANSPRIIMCSTELIGVAACQYRSIYVNCSNFRGNPNSIWYCRKCFRSALEAEYRFSYSNVSPCSVLGQGSLCRNKV